MNNSFFLWTQLAWKTGVMMLDSAEVIGHRTGRMAVAGARPTVRDQREFMRMSQEKFEAAFESMQAMAMHMTGVHARFGMRAFEQSSAAVAALASVLASRTAHEAVGRQTALLSSLAGTPLAVSQFSDSVARLVHAGIAPIHARASANAKRLRRR
jgi:hypothetical protein